MTNPSQWEHDTTTYLDLTSDTSQVPAEDKTQLQYNSSEKESLYTENDTANPWRVTIGSGNNWTSTTFENKPTLKKSDGNNSGITITSLGYAEIPNPLPATGYKSVTLNLSAYSSSKLGDNVLPKGIVINNRPVSYTHLTLPTILLV